MHAGRDGIEAGCARITQPALVIGISSDMLYPLSDQQRLAKLLPNAELVVVQSPHGHDGFLLEQAQVAPLIQAFLDRPV
jgi:homoserine O-acetyltransferase